MNARMNGRTNDWRHLAHLTDGRGLFEHAHGATPRHDHGYCTDDNGRALVVVCRAGDDHALALAERQLAFCYDAYVGDGRFRLRMSYDGTWRDHAVSDDAMGRAIWGLGVAATSAWSQVATDAARLFDDACAFRTAWPRAAACAVLGAAAYLRRRPDHEGANALLDAMRSVLEATSWTGPDRPAITEWCWPEPRLQYANALLPHAELEIAARRQDPVLADAALRRLRWLRDVETHGDHLSFTPTNGWAQGEPRPGFDQQPIEAWHLAEAAWSALSLTGDPAWAATIERCEAWFHGANDTGAVMFDPETGGGYDGLRADGVNQNQGAESTLAWLAVSQLAGFARASADVAPAGP